MNAKAQRQEMQWPPLLNMSDNRPAIHNNFQSAERINAPFVNDMVTPHYKKEVKTEYKTTFDKYDNKYDIHDGALYKNDEKLFDVDNRKFVQEDVTNQYNKYLAFDYDDEGNLASLVHNGNNSFSISYKDTTFNTPILFINGAVLATRVRCIKGRPITVIVYNNSNKLYMGFYDGTRFMQPAITWCTQVHKAYWDSGKAVIVTPDTLASQRNLYPGISISKVNPLIQISNPLGNYFAVSIASNYSEQLNTTSEAYYTFITDVSTGQYMDGPWCKPQQGNIWASVEQYLTDDFIFTDSSSVTNRKSYQLYQDEEGNWLDVNTRQPPAEDTEGMEPEYTGTTIPIDGVNVPVYTASYNTVNYTYSCKAQIQSGHAYKYYVKIEGAAELEQTLDVRNNQSTDAVVTKSGWGLSLGNVTLTQKIIDTNDNNKEYDITNTSLQITQTKVIENSPVGWVIAPNFFLDDGSMRAWYTIKEWDSAMTGIGWFPIENYIAYNYPNGMNVIVESGQLTGVNFTTGTYSFNYTDFFRVSGEWNCVPRNNCISVGQNFWSSSTMLCSIQNLTPLMKYVNQLSGDYNYSYTKKYTSYSVSNTTGMRFYAGVEPNSDYKFYKTATAGYEDVAWFNTGGFRSKATRGNWNILYYSSVDSVSDIEGLSWSENENMMGTLVAPWSKVDSSFYIVFTDDFMIYKNTDGRIIKVSIEEGNDLRSEFNNTFIIVNTTSYWNCYDVENQKKYHYATDYNNRLKFGMPRALWTDWWSYNLWIPKDSIQTASSVNAVFDSISKDSITSIQEPASSYSYFWSNYFDAYQSQCPIEGQEDVQKIEVFYQDATGSSNLNFYKFSIVPRSIITQVRDPNLVNYYYKSASTNYSPDIFAKYINGAGNNDFIKEGKAAYPITFNNFGRPAFVFVVTGEALDVEAFFVIQGQYYAVMNEKIYALSYMNGYIQNQDAVIDVRGMKFVGNTPEIAFFWSEKKKAFYSYTGDGILQQIFDATKYSLEMFSFKYYYDETVQSIWIPTTAGLLCFGAKNTYLMEDIVDVENVIFTENYTYIVHKNGYTILTYFYEDDFEPVPIELETSFYGVGNNEVSTIDRWQITLYDERHPKVDVKLSVRSITDVTVKAEEKVFHIGESDWDKWSHSILLSYSPKLIKGQGIRLYIETPVAIQKIVPHVADQGYANTTRFTM